MKSFKVTQSITNKDDISIKLYLKEISKIPLIDKDREIELSKRIMKGDKKAVDELVTANLRFVVTIAKKYRNQGLPLIDLIDEGNIGLIKAAEKFDWSKGFKFISYAVWWIRQSIMQALSLKGKTVKLPINQSVAINKINKISEEFEQKNGRKPSYSEISSISGIDENKIPEILSYHKTCVSVDTPFTADDDSGCLLDVIPNDNASNSDDNINKESDKKGLLSILNKLSPRERVSVQLFFGLNCEKMPLEKISKLLGVTAERVRQLKEKALDELRKNYKEQLKEFL